MEVTKYLKCYIRAATTTHVTMLLLMAAVTSTKSYTLLEPLLKENESDHCQRDLSDPIIQYMRTDESSMDNIFRRLLPKILIERVPGTQGNIYVREFIKKEMTTLGWLVEEDTFRQSTPIGEIIFSNIIATLNPNARKRVVIACHYDSKMLPGPIPFVGAIDSAVGLAVMMDTARKLNLVRENVGVNHYERKISATMYELRSSGGSPRCNLEYSETILDITLQLIFFDGEEAFVRWTDTDSLYGSRHLASLWERTRDLNDPRPVNKLVNIEFFILLDLIGTSDTRFVNYYKNTSKYFNQLVNIEQCLKINNLLKRQSPEGIFNPNGFVERVEDDHTPFFTRHVPVLHLISTPFPSVWHTVDDNLNSLDINLIDDFSQILNIFLTTVLF